MQKILGIMLGICILIGSALMSYMFGSRILNDYYMFGILGVCISFVVGVILFGIVLFFINKIASKYTTNKERNV